MTRKTIILRHIFFWLIFIAYEVAFLRITAGYFAPFINATVFYLLNVSLFYFNAHVVLDFAFFRTKIPYIVAPMLIIVELIGYLSSKGGLDYLLNSNHGVGFSAIVVNQLYLITNVWRGLYFIGLSIAYWSMLYMVRFKERNHKMETEHLKSITKSLELQNRYMSVENAYLQNQISPHLLFNSLNFIHNKVYKQSAEAGDSVARLSELMRYSLVSADDTRTVLLGQEVKQLENLIALCQMRFRNEFFLKFKKSGKIATIQVMPLILITLVENMMKHGDLGDKKIPAHIYLEVNENRLLFTTFNKKRNTNLYPKNGVGLKNVEKRLGNFYQDRYTFLEK
jgi:two-component system LytT family sensor kinase